MLSRQARKGIGRYSIIAWTPNIHVTGACVSWIKEMSRGVKASLKQYFDKNNISKGGPKKIHFESTKIKKKKINEGIHKIYIRIKL